MFFLCFFAHDFSVITKNLLDRRHIVKQYKVKVQERIVLREIHLRATGRHLSMGSHSVICHPTEVTTPPSPQPGRLVLDLSTPKG